MRELDRQPIQLFERKTDLGLRLGALRKIQFHRGAAQTAIGAPHHRATGAAQDDNVGVVYLDALGRCAYVSQRFGQKHLAIEAGEVRVNLEEQHARVT